MEVDSQHTYEYDLFVIGGGSGGISAARWACKAGAKVAIADFEATVGEFIESGAGDRETALRWMAMEETFYNRQCVEHWVFDRGFLFTSHGKAVVEELMNVVTFEEFDDE